MYYDKKPEEERKARVAEADAKFRDLMQLRDGVTKQANNTARARRYANMHRRDNIRETLNHLGFSHVRGLFRRILRRRPLSATQFYNVTSAEPKP